MVESNSSDSALLLLTEFNRIVAEKTAAAGDDRITLRDAVCKYFTAERGRGTTVSTIVRSVNDILLKAHRAGSAQPDPELAQLLIDWCVGQPQARLRLT